jgi:hypothetical protein
MNEDNFDRFVNSLIKEKDLKGLTPEGREQVAAELKNLISEEVNRAILMELSDEKLDELDKLMDNGPLSESQMQEFLQTSGVDIPKVTTKTLMYFRSFYLGGK